jgi:hemerythrin superfamily protein
VDAVDYLITQHRRLEGRMARLEAAATDAERVALLAEVGDDLTVHLASEEQVFYPAVRAASTEDILLESLEEHLSLKRLLDDLLGLAPDATTFEPKFKVLKEQTEHHHQEEEEHLFPKVKSLIGGPERAALGERMRSLQLGLRRDGEPRAAVADQTDAAAPLR